MKVICIIINFLKPIKFTFNSITFGWGLNTLSRLATKNEEKYRKHIFLGWWKLKHDHHYITPALKKKKILLEELLLSNVKSTYINKLFCSMFIYISLHLVVVFFKACWLVWKQSYQKNRTLNFLYFFEQYNILQFVFSSPFVTKTRCLNCTHTHTHTHIGGGNESLET